ncbi:hypothetical protein SESBI_32436 [Sesbania bispinosa]|nr:hypothetical protein SESBI_32436 [Sesbania bispinosa]
MPSSCGSGRLNWCGSWSLQSSMETREGEGHCNLSGKKRRPCKGERHVITKKVKKSRRWGAKKSNVLDDWRKRELYWWKKYLKVELKKRQ